MDETVTLHRKAIAPEKPDKPDLEESPTHLKS